MLLLYLDEFGHAGAWNPHDPRHSQHPLFGLAGVIIPASRARDLDRGYLRLKETYYRTEISKAFDTQGKRAERYEPKQLSNERDYRFAYNVLRLVQRLDGLVLAHGVAKTIGIKGHNEVALYHSLMQEVLCTFDTVISHRDASNGIVIADRRSEFSDLQLLASAQSYLFSKHERVGRIAETPLLVRSDWHHGVQAADTVGRIIAAVHRYRTIGDQQHDYTNKRFTPLLDEISLLEPPKIRLVLIRSKTTSQ